MSHKSQSPGEGAAHSAGEAVSAKLNQPGVGSPVSKGNSQVGYILPILTRNASKTPNILIRAGFGLP